MAAEYPGTVVPFPQMDLPDLRDPVLSGPGHRALEDAVGSYRQFAAMLSAAGGGIEAVLAMIPLAHEGAAAELSRRALRTMSGPADTGYEKSLLAAQALEDQGGYVARVRADMQAADPGPTLSGTDAVVLSAVAPTAAPAIAGVAAVGYLERHAAREQAAEAATRYQDNTNWNLGAGFQAFPAPDGPNPDQSPGAAGGPAFQVGPAGVLAAGGAGGAGLGPGGGAAAGHLPGAAVGVGSVPVAAGGGASGGTPEIAGPGPAGPGRAGVGVAGGLPAGGPTTGAGTTGARPGGLGTGAAERAPGSSFGPGSAGTGVGLAPQSYRPDGRRGTGQGTGILAGVPPLPGNGVIAPDGDRRSPAWGSAVPDGPVDRAPLDRQPPPTGAPAGPAGRGTPGHTGMPFMGGAGAGQGADREHRRPSWLVQDDPEAFWFAGLPDHSDPVIAPDVDG